MKVVKTIFNFAFRRCSDLVRRAKIGGLFKPA